MALHTPRRVVVVGAGPAGLLAAHVLAGHADTVTVVERDRLPYGPYHRPGVPQSHHTHLLIPGGQRALEGLLPGVLRELVRHGAVRCALPRDVVQHTAGQWDRRFGHDSLEFLSCTRPLLDWVVRRRVLAHSRIRIVEGTTALGLLGDGGTVRGLRVRSRRAATADAYALAADLVVDASGRSSAGPAWLAELRGTAPAEERVDPGLAYATALYRGPAPDDLSFGAVVLQHARGNPRGALLFPVERERWTLTAYGLRGHHPATGAEGFADFLRGLADPVLASWAEKHESISPVRGFRNTANRRYRYHRERSPLAGFLALGDACCTVNPIYGQGMAVAACQARELREALSDGTYEGDTRRLQQRISAVSETPWRIATGGDLSHPTTIGERPGPAARAGQWYVNRLVARAGGDRIVGDAVRDVLGLLAPPSRLFAPRVAATAFLRPRQKRPDAFPEYPET